MSLVRRFAPIVVTLLAGACSSFTSSTPPGSGADAGLDGEPSDASVDPGPVPLDPPVAVSAGGGLGCVLRTSGAVDCWGDNATGAIAAPADGQDGCSGLTAACVPVATRSPLAARAARISAGDGFVCAVLSGSPGAVQCWGNNRLGTLGDGKRDAISLSPVEVRLAGPALGVEAGRGNACARVMLDGTVRVQCWGTRTIGLTGKGPTNEIDVPVVVDGVDGSTALSLSVTDPGSACIIGAQNLVTCWGGNRYGAIGHGPETGGGCTVDGPYAGNDHPCSSTPRRAESQDPTNAVATGVFTTCALRTSGAVACWGFNGWGGHATGSVDDGTHTAAVASVGLQGKVTKLTGRSGHFCALLDDGSAWCWGASGQKQLGAELDPSRDGVGLPRRAQPSPQRVALDGITDISAGEDFTLAIAGDEVYAWGTNGRGQLGHPPGQDPAAACEGAGRCNGTPTRVPLPQLAVTR